MARKFWTEEEIEFLRKASKTMTLSQISEELGRSKGSIKCFASRHDISFSLRGYPDGEVRRNWTRAEVTALMGYAESCSMKMAAARMGRSYESVANKVNVLGISFSSHRLRLSDVAEILGISARTVAIRRNKLGLNFRRSTGKKSSVTRGARGSDIVAIAQDILDNPPMKNLPNTSARKLRQVIEDYRDWE